MRPLFLVVATLLPSAFGLTCPTNYDDGGNGYCYKGFYNKTTRELATKQCYSDGGRLPLIDNAFTNNAVLHNIMGSYTWTGLICQNAQKTSCRYDGASSSLNTSSYDNFAPGQPDPSKGPYVYVNGNTGKWFSAGYASMMYLCEVVKGNPSIGCGQGYTQIGNSCYSYANVGNATAVESECQADGAHTVSIHSAQENNDTLALLQQHTWSSSYYLIGLVLNANNNLSWTDGTQYDYNNFGVQNSKYGDCATVAARDGVVPRGQWISSNCDKLYPSICKKSLQSKYNSTTWPVLSPRTCSNTQFMNGGGTIYSPNYPYTYNVAYNYQQNCVYVLTGTRDIVTFTLLQTDFNSEGYIDLYNDVTDDKPFTSIYSNSAAGTSYNSTGPVMKVVFTSRTIYPNLDLLTYGSWSAFYY